MNGKRGDHPLTDILAYNLPVFSPEADALIKDIVRLGGDRELERRFNFFSPPPLAEFEARLREMRDQLRNEAKERGWEID
jgi:hypothetical protein